MRGKIHQIWRIKMILFGMLMLLHTGHGVIDCPSGYDDCSGICVDVDECGEIQEMVCGLHAQCYNTEGSFYCQCQQGFMTSGGRVNFTDISGEHCRDVNECEEIAELCGKHAECFNTAGSFYCQCQQGFTNIRGEINFTALNGQCQDINECLTPPCGPGAYCNNTVGAYTCICLPGYTNSSDGCVGFMLRFIVVSVGLAALILAVVTVTIWTRIKGNKTQIDPDADQDDEGFGSVVYENVGDHEASVRI